MLRATGMIPRDDTLIWPAILERAPAAVEASSLYGPIIEGPIVLGRITQSLDGRIAAATGASFWIGGAEDILHTHRLRALFDAVIVGAGTVRADDPLLTTRHCLGPSPVRVVIDAERRLPVSHRVFNGGPRTLLVCAEDRAGGARHGDAEVVGVARGAGGLAPADIVAALRARGLLRLFVEGGGTTVSRFFAAGVLDRLHVTIAPLLLGAGVDGFVLPGVNRPEDGWHLDWSVHRLGHDVLFDIDLRRTVR